MNQLKELQSLLYSSAIDVQVLRTKITELKDTLSPKVIDRQLILSFFLNYEKMPILIPLLSKTQLEEKDFIHFDQELIFHLMENNVSFPDSVFKKLDNIIEPCLYDELVKNGKKNLLTGRDRYGYGNGSKALIKRREKS